MERDFDHHTVLLAEDSADDAELMTRAWRAAGLKNQLNYVLDGEEVLAYLKGANHYYDRSRYPFPISLFLDLKLPRVGGLEILATIRSDPHLRNLNVDVLSASLREADVDKALELGANSYLLKPGRFSDLVEMLGAWKVLAQSRKFSQPPGTR